MEKYKVLKVTKIEHYLVPIYKNNITEINGWDIIEVIKNWFTKKPLQVFHATRDAHNVGNSSYVEKVEIVDKINIDDKISLKIEGIKSEE